MRLAPLWSPVAQSLSGFSRPLPEVSFCGLEVSQYTISQFISPQSMSISGSPPLKIMCKYQCHPVLSDRTPVGRWSVAFMCLYEPEPFIGMRVC